MSITRYLSIALPVLALATAGGLSEAALGASPSAAVSSSSGGLTAAGTSAAKKKKKPAARRGGRVRAAWPAKHGKDRPKTPLTRWLARQVGATTSRCPARKGSRVRCASRTKSTRTASVARAASASSPVASAAADGSLDVSIRARARSEKDPLQLVRSYEIPTDDPAYVRTLNFSWTYDSAVAAAGFVAADDRVQSERLLDQLAALQRTDGSIDSAFDVSDGAGSEEFTSGTIAWVGLAEVTHDRTFDDKRYLKPARAAADYLLSLQLDQGLIRGGPAVKWASTLHNLVAYAFIGELGEVLTARGSDAGARYTAEAERIGAAIDTHLLVRDDRGTHFIQGLDDTAEPLDVQALGVVYLLGRGDPEEAKAVREYAEQHFAIGDRSVALSKDPETFNMTYEAKGPFRGYRPFANEGAPDILWSEGTNEMRLAQSALGEDTAPLDEAIARFAKVTAGEGFAPLQSDRTDNGRFGEFHVWPAAAPAAWTLLSRAAPSFFYAPGASPAVTAWTKISGAKAIATFPDGRVDMLEADGGERRVLSTDVSARDATVTVDGTLNYGSGWGVYLRASADRTSGAVTGYCVQVDQGLGQIVVRQIDDDRELPVALAGVTPASGPQLTGRHRLVARIVGNTLTVSFDDEDLIAIPDLAAASAEAAKASGQDPASFPGPTSGKVGLRAWNAAQVLINQVTVVKG